MIEHSKTCIDLEIKHDCQKCEVTNLTKANLLKHLTDECENIEVFCSKCNSDPVKRIDFN